MIRNHLMLVSAALATIVAAALLLPAGDAQAHDQDTYRFRLDNAIAYSAQIRCGTSGDWTTVSGGTTGNVTCDGSTAQWKHAGVSAVSETWGCTAEQPVHQVRLTSESLKFGVHVERSCQY